MQQSQALAQEDLDPIDQKFWRDQRDQILRARRARAALPSSQYAWLAAYFGFYAVSGFVCGTYWRSVDTPGDPINRSDLPLLVFMVLIVTGLAYGAAKWWEMLSRQRRLISLAPKEPVSARRIFLHLLIPTALLHSIGAFVNAPRHPNHLTASALAGMISGAAALIAVICAASAARGTGRSPLELPPRWPGGSDYWVEVERINKEQALLDATSSKPNTADTTRARRWPIRCR